MSSVYLVVVVSILFAAPLSGEGLQPTKLTVPE